MSTIEQSIDVNVPVHTAYNQWTQFEEFPQFMEGAEEVRQLDDRRLHWRANIGGRVEEWDAVVTEQHPDERIAWKNTTGAPNAGVVTFHRLADNKTRIMLQMEYDPQGVVENLGDLLGMVSRRVANDLERFKAFIEARGHETGAWRGEVERPGQ
jgi:uncharacterized membrane protein